MDGRDMVKIIDEELLRRGMTQYEFCHAIGIQSSAMSAWRKGSKPKPERIAQIEKFLNISFSDYEKSEQLEELRDDLRVLLKSAKDLPPSSVYEIVAEVERRKENAT